MALSFLNINLPTSIKFTGTSEYKHESLPGAGGRQGGDFVNHLQKKFSLETLFQGEHKTRPNRTRHKTASGQPGPAQNQTAQKTTTTTLIPMDAQWQHWLVHRTFPDKSNIS